MGTTKSTKSKMHWFNVRIRMASDRGVSLNLDKNIAEFCIEHNSTRVKAMEILKVFELSDKITMKDKEIIPNELL